MPDRKTGNSIDFGVIGGPRTVKATAQVLSAKFLTPVVTYGKSAAAYLAVLPGANQRALTWKRRGITTFRWCTPTVMTSSGLTVGAAFTPTFHLTVR